MRSHLGTFGLTTVGAINNAEQLVESYFADGGRQLMAMGSGAVNTTELVAALITRKTTSSRASSTRRRPSKDPSRCSS